MVEHVLINDWRDRPASRSELWEDVDRRKKPVLAAVMNKGAAGQEAALETKSPALLKERFARSEIDKPEFEERRQVLAAA